MFPVRNFKYLIEIDGIQIGFSEVSGLDAKVKEIGYREGSGKLDAVRNMPGLFEYGQITLKRGTDVSLTLFSWINDACTGNIVKKIVTLTAIGGDGTPAAIWRIINAWPVSYDVSEFKGMGNDTILESLVLSHEGMTRDL